MVVTSVVLGISVTLIIIFLTYLFIDINSVEKLSKQCSSIIPVLEKYRQDNGKYPKELILPGISEQLKISCNYKIENNSYIFSLTGGKGNLQAYVYNSERNIWYWD